MVNERALLEAVVPGSVTKPPQRAIGIESTNPPGDETNLARWLERSFGGCLSGQVSPRENGRVNLLARIRGTGGCPALVFSVHLDTVSAGKWA